MGWEVLTQDNFNAYTPGQTLPSPPWTPLIAPIPAFRGSSGGAGTAVSGQEGYAARQNHPAANARQYVQWAHRAMTLYVTAYSMGWVRLSHVDAPSLASSANANGYVAQQVNTGTAGLYVVVGGYGWTKLGSDIPSIMNGWGPGAAYLCRLEAEDAALSYFLSEPYAHGTAPNPLVYRGGRTDATYPTGFPAGLALDNWWDSVVDDWESGHWVDANHLLLGIPRGFGTIR